MGVLEDEASIVDILAYQFTNVSFVLRTDFSELKTTTEFLTLRCIHRIGKVM